MQGQLLPMTELDPDGSIKDCSMTDVHVLDFMGGSHVSQWIYNGLYAWTRVNFESAGFCIFLERPERRGLNREESQMLYSAAKRMWPVEPAKSDPADVPPLRHEVPPPSIQHDPTTTQRRPLHG